MDTKFDEQVICGPQYVALREIDSGTRIDTGGFVLAQKSMQNSKLGFYKVESVGKEAEEQYGVHVGDYVFADRLASFYHSSPVALMDCHNVIAITNKTASEIHPPKNKLLVDEDTHEMANYNGFYVDTSSSIPRTGKILELTVENADYPFVPGDHVMLVKGGDNVNIGKHKYWIFNPQDIICKLIKES